MSDTNVSNGSFGFGEVVQVSDVSDKYSVGDVVMYNTTNQIVLTLLTDTYFLIYEEDIIFKDGNPL